MYKPSKLKGNIFMLLLMIYLVLNQLFFQFIVNIYSFKYNSNLQTIFLSASFIIPFLIYIIITKQKIKKVLTFNPVSLLTVFSVVLISIFIQLPIAFINSITGLVFENTASTYILKVLEEPFILLFISTAIMPAICEEIIFRGVINNEYRNEKLFLSCFISGLFFGIMHLNFSQFFYATLIGFIFNYLLRKSNSIIPAMVGHFTINGSQLLLARLSLFIAKSTPEGLKIYEESLASAEKITTGQIEIIGYLSVFALSILYFCFRLFNYSVKNSKYQIETPTEENIQTESNEIQSKTNIKKNIFYYGSMFLAVSIFLFFAIKIHLASKF